MAFITPAQFLLAYDHRIIGQLVSDDGTEATYASLLTDPNLQELLDQAAGEILAYTLRGEIYSETTLDGLTGSSQAYLRRLNADLAYYFIVLRRGLNLENYPQFKNAFEALRELANGKQVFNVPENSQAGHMQNNPIQIESVIDQNFLVDNVYYFANRRWTINQQ